MNNELLITLCLLGVCMAAFILNRPRMDLVALLAFLALPLSGVLEFKEVLSVFSDSSIVIIALMFVLSAGLMRTGVSHKISWLILKYSGGNPTRLMVLIMISVALMGSVMSTTGIVAIFVPIVLAICTRLKISPAKLMMPLGFAGITSGMMTLIGTSPNLIVNGVLARSSFDGFGFFDITPIGILVLIAGILYMLYARKFLGNSKKSSKEAMKRVSISDFARDYALEKRERIFKVPASSPIVGKYLNETKMRELYGAGVVSIERRGRMNNVRLIDPVAGTRVNADDVLLIDTYSPELADKMADDLKLKALSLHGAHFSDRSDEGGMIEIVISPESSLIGKTLVEIQFRTHYHLHAIGIRRKSKAIDGNLSEEKLRMGDIILLIGSWRSVRHLKADTKDFMVLNVPEEYDSASTAPERAPLALLSLSVMVLLMISGLVPNALAVFIACALMVLFKCIDMDKAYSSIHWPTLMLIMGMMPFAIALEKTGGIDIAARFLMLTFGEMGPRGMLLGLCIATMITGLFMSNTITAVLMAPLAIAAAEAMGTSPYPFAMGIAVAASTAFMTPLSTTVNMLILGPGRYTFFDFVRIGVPFAAIVTIINVTVVPILFPF